MPPTRFFRVLLILLLAFGSGFVAAADLRLSLPASTNGNHLYYHRLLVESLRAAGHSVVVEVEYDMPQQRLWSQLDSGKLTLLWMLPTAERDQRYVRIRHDLTQGLTGQRVLLIRPGDERRFAALRDRQQLAATGLIAGLGKGWYDVRVWEVNGLPFFEQPGDWRNLFSMVARGNRGVDYLPRSVTEIEAEAERHPDLAIEPNLLLVYPGSFVFYLSPHSAELAPLISAALLRAEKSGLQKRLMDEHFGPALRRLKLDRRTRIVLNAPPAP